MQIKIGFSTSNGWLPRIIRFFTRAKVSHTFILMQDALYGRDMVLEAAWLGFTMRTLDGFIKAGNQVVALIDPKQPIDAGVDQALGWLDTLYDYTGLLGMAVVEIGRYLKRQWHNPSHGPHALFCSEANTKILQLSGYPGADKLVAEETSPEDLLEFLNK
jgi:hypothetical protein